MNQAGSVIDSGKHRSLCAGHDLAELFLCADLVHERTDHKASRGGQLAIFWAVEVSSDAAST